MNWMAAIRIFAAAVTAATLFATPAFSQGFGGKKGGGGKSGYPVENHPKIDEKAYKAALDRIPVPDKKYDPWGIARPADPASAGKKPN